MIYLASPYSHNNPSVMQARFKMAEKYTALLLQQGRIIFSPIVHCHELARTYELPTDFSFWQNYCLGMLAKADELWVLQLDGWKHSTGVAAEIEFADENEMPILLRDFPSELL